MKKQVETKKDEKGLAYLMEKLHTLKRTELHQLLVFARVSNETWSIIPHLKKEIESLGANELSSLIASANQGTTQNPEVDYPIPVIWPKFRNLENPSQYWTGIGMMPNWFKAALQAGTTPDQMRIIRK